MERLTELLNGVHDSYHDFVVGVVTYAKRNSNNLKEMTKYIEDNPEAGTSEILGFMLSREDYYEHAQRIIGVAPQMQNRA